MEYVQDGVTTLHDFGAAPPSVPTDRAAVVVPMTEREYRSPAAERVLSTLESLAVERVVVPLRAEATDVESVRTWLSSFDVPVEVLWCDGPRLGSLLGEAGLNGTRGKGRDVWLALGLASRSEHVVVHDADARGYDDRHVRKLLYPLVHGHEFSKAYYARVEDDRLYGRLFRLFYRPLVEALADGEGATPSVLEYLDAFRYALAGEFALSGALARRMHVQRGWGLEVGTLGEAFRLVGTDGSAQVDLGVHEHDHRSVSGPAGLSDMSEQVGRALFQALEDNGADPDYDGLEDRYRDAARRLVDAYELDASFNGLGYDRTDELRQVDAYAGAVRPPGEDARLPPWVEAPIDPAEIAAAAGADLEAVVEASGGDGAGTVDTMDTVDVPSDAC